MRVGTRVGAFAFVLMAALAHAAVPVSKKTSWTSKLGLYDFLKNEATCPPCACNQQPQIGTAQSAVNRNEQSVLGVWCA